MIERQLFMNEASIRIMFKGEATLHLPDGSSIYRDRDGDILYRSHFGEKFNKYLRSVDEVVELAAQAAGSRLMEH